jgi:alpha-tubulin suppressor-like RCC1 family protein
MNFSHDLGDGTVVDREQLTPEQIGTDTNWAEVSGAMYHANAVKTDGTLWHWGDISTGTDQATPAQIGTATTWSQVSSGPFHNVALKADGTLWAWGDNGSGELGDGTTTDQPSPEQIGTSTWTNIAAWGSTDFGNNTLAIRSDGTLWAWGDNRFNQLGDGTTTTHTTPEQIGTDTDWSQVVANAALKG